MNFFSKDSLWIFTNDLICLHKNCKHSFKNVYSAFGLKFKGLKGIRTSHLKSQKILFKKYSLHPPQQLEQVRYINYLSFK